jgi:hypothetical protein
MSLSTEPPSSRTLQKSLRRKANLASIDPLLNQLKEDIVQIESNGLTDNERVMASSARLLFAPANNNKERSSSAKKKARYKLFLKTLLSNTCRECVLVWVARRGQKRALKLTSVMKELCNKIRGIIHLFQAEATLTSLADEFDIPKGTNANEEDQVHVSIPPIPPMEWSSNRDENRDLASSLPTQSDDSNTRTKRTLEESYDPSTLLDTEYSQSGSMSPRSNGDGGYQVKRARLHIEEGTEPNGNAKSNTNTTGEQNLRQQFQIFT